MSQSDNSDNSDNEDNCLNEGTKATQNIYFDLHDKIIDRMSNNSYMIKITGKELIHYVKNWCFNRTSDDDKIQELYDIKKNSTAVIEPTWIFTLIYDEMSDNFDKLYMIDGQHRREVIKRLLVDNPDSKEQYYCIVYNINYCETENQNLAIDLFKKINNNKPLSIPDIPDMYICDIVYNIINNNILNPNKSIKIKKENNKANNPYIHKKELFNLLNNNMDKIKMLSKDKFIENLTIIRNKLCFKEFKDLYKLNDDNKKKYDTAKKIDFWLNLKTSKYPPEEWIKYITVPHELI